MKLLLACLILMPLGLCQAEVPKLFTERAVNSANLAEAVNHFVAIGEDATIKELDKLVAQDSSDTNWRFNKKYNIDERIGWLCRILYEPKEPSLLIPKLGILIPEKPKSLRAPAFGVLSLPESTMPIENWPLFPVAVSGSTYIILKQGYTPAGQPEEVKHYIAYCKNNGIFRKTPVPVPTKEQAEKDIANLRQSAQWQVIQWEGNNGFSYPMGEQLTWAFIQSQAKTIVNESMVSQNTKNDSAVFSLR
jgi:hypothetical protein